MPTAETAPTTLADLIERVQVDGDLPARKRANLASSVRSFARHTGCGLHVAATFPTLRGFIRRVAPAAAGIGKARWSNICSDVAFALRRYRAPTRAPLPRDLMPEWRALQQQLDTDNLRLGLCRFIHWCSRQDIAPAAVGDAVAVRFHGHLKSGTFIQKPNRLFRHTIKLWNDAATGIPGWPQRRLSLPSFRNLVSLPLPDFPHSFAADLAAYGRWASGSDLTSTALRDPLRPATIEGRQRQLRRIASAMVRFGRPVAEIANIATLFAADWLPRALQAELERMSRERAPAGASGGSQAPRSFPSLQEMAGGLIAVGQHYLRLPAPALAQLRQVKRRLKCRPRGFTDKNRDRLRPLADIGNQERFLHLPDRLLAPAKKRPRSRKTALLVQTALIHDLLIVAPMRFGNLAGLNSFRHFRRSGSGRGVQVIVVIPGHEVKNGQDLEFALPAPTTSLLDLYCRIYRPLLLEGPDEGWLFPGRGQAHKHQVSLSQQLCMAVRRHCGLAINPHLYRHIAAYLYLQAHPGDYETVRRLLGHTSLETTMMFYADFERAFAMRRYADHILERRQELARRPARSNGEARRLEA